MPEKCITLPDAENEAQAALRGVLQELNWGIVLCLGVNAQQAFDMACGFCKQDFMRCSAMLAKNPAHIRPIVESLTGGDTVNWDEFGHRIVVIDWNDSVVKLLSITQATSEIRVLNACLIASGGGH
ncbi:MAG: hypothetical protein KF784_08825 [Fimbriimonadaceae bacterium]|nr:hypothetical protein [Fimbriimonadaceae bacterium]